MWSPLASSSSTGARRPWDGSRGDSCILIEEEIEEGVAQCREGLQCMQDIRFGGLVGLCCRPGERACGYQCFEPCPAGQHMEPINCECVGCDLEAPCPAVGQTRHADTCECRCPQGEIPCEGVCIDPLTDETFCGGCPGSTCNPATQLCCNGVCTDIGTDANCRDCGDQVPDGYACCEYQPTQLGTPTNCAACDDLCILGEQCINGVCDCPAGTQRCGVGCCPLTRTCCNGVCCSLPLGQGCCNGACTNLNTNVAHCGGCGNRCATGASCVSGSCTCPPNHIPCFGVCRNNMTVPQGSAWLKWRQNNPGVPIFTCLNDVFKCHATLKQFPEGCCPLGCTGVAGGQCTGCPS